MDFNTISYSTAFNINNGTAAKRKLEDDDYLVMSHKRLYKLNTQHQEQYKENTTLPIMAQTTSSFTFSHSNSNNNNNSNSDMSQDTLDSDTSDDKLQQGQVEMMDYDLTDEDESLQTPSSMNDFTVIEEDESDFIGDLEKGWIEMFSESYYPYY